MEIVGGYKKTVREAEKSQKSPPGVRYADHLATVQTSQLVSDAKLVCWCGLGEIRCIGSPCRKVCKFTVQLVNGCITPTLLIVRSPIWRTAVAIISNAEQVQIAQMGNPGLVQGLIARVTWPSKITYRPQLVLDKIDEARAKKERGIPGCNIAHRL